MQPQHCNPAEVYHLPWFFRRMAAQSSSAASLGMASIDHLPLPNQSISRLRVAGMIVNTSLRFLAEVELG
ncbi:hypothetical protein ACFLUU_05760 [Chloroflexota bacterium]